MTKTSARRALALAGIGLLLPLLGCGKKAPLRLSDDRVAEQAPALRARVRDGQVTLEFRVPARRVFPEREEPWVLARILRQVAPTSESVEVGAILDKGGFDFGSQMTWSDSALPPKSSFIYRVEFRDAVRRRRAVTAPLAVSWDRVPAAPQGLNATGHLRSVVLTWEVPAGEDAGTRYRIYRRGQVQATYELATPEPVPAGSYTDSRIEADRDYCYVVRAVLTATTLEVEGPSSPERCARPAAEAPLTP